MRKLPLLFVALGALTAAAGSWTALAQRRTLAELPTPAGAPVGARALLYARPFTLAQPYAYEWRAERPEVSSGWLLVIQADPAICVPTQEYEPVLCVGEQTAERVNTGRESGRVVAVVPSALGAGGEPALELAKARVFWGSPRLPEQVDAAVLAAESQSARIAGIEPLSAAAARARGGATLACADRDELLREAARLIQAFAPPEAEFARGLLAPRVR